MDGVTDGPRKEKYTTRKVKLAARRDINVANMQAKMSVLQTRIELSANEAQHQQV